MSTRSPHETPISTHDYWSVGWETETVELFQRLKDEAIALGETYIREEHLLLALVAITPKTQHGLAALNHDLVQAVIRDSKSPSEADFHPITPWCQTPRFKRVVENAMRRAFENSRRVNCRDIWHGLLSCPQSECNAVFEKLGLSVTQLRDLLT